MRISDWSSDVCSSDLDKVTAVGTHLFFRWTGWWGTPPAFNRDVLSSEPAIAMLAPLSDAHRAAIGLAVGAPGSVDAATLANAALPVSTAADPDSRSEEHTSELQSLMRISYAVFCLKKKKNTKTDNRLEQKI